MAARNKVLIPEVVETPADSLRLVACKSPFSTQRIDLIVKAGGTLADIMRGAGLNPACHARVFVDDVLFEREWWPLVCPEAGQTVTVRVVPAGGGGGGGKDTLRIVMMIAVVALAIYAPYGLAALGVEGMFVTTAGVTSLSLAGSLVGAAVGIIGSLAIGGSIPPARPSLMLPRGSRRPCPTFPT